MTMLQEPPGNDDQGPLLPPGLLTPLPLDEARIQNTVSLARRSAHRRYLRAVLALLLLPVVLMIGLLASGGYRWDGRDLEALTFGNAILLIDEFDTYSSENARCAQAKLGNEMEELLRSMNEWGTLTPDIRASVREALDSPQPQATRYPGGFEGLRDQIKSGEQLTAAQTETLRQALAAGIGAIRRLGSVHERHQERADWIARSLRKQVEAR